MSPLMGGESELASNSAKPEEESEHKEVMEKVIDATDHLKRHHLVHSVMSQHLNATTMFLEKFILKIGKRKTNSGIKNLQLNTDLPQRRQQDHGIKCRELYIVIIYYSLCSHG